MLETLFRFVAKQVEGVEPVLIADLAGPHEGPGLDAEMLSAFLLTATKRHGLMLASSLDVGDPAVGTADLFRPTSLDEPCFSGLVIREQLEEIDGSKDPL